MKDQIQLLIVALLLSFSAWVFWRYSGEAGFLILSSITVLVVVSDNMRLRRKLKDAQEAKVQQT